MANRTRGHQINFYVTDAEYKKIEKQRKKAKMLKGNFYREMLLRDKIDIKVVQYDDLRALIQQVGLVRNDIDELKHQAKQNGAVTSSEVKSMNDNLQKIWQLMKTTFDNIQVM